MMVAKTVVLVSLLALAGLTVLALNRAVHGQAQPRAAHGTSATATFAGGCFWCMQPPFEQLDGVVSTTVGYTGGHTTHPTYEQVSAGGTGHAESVQVVYDPAKISYTELLDVFWHNIDPLTPNGQFCDHGTQYRTAIFVHDESQRRLAEASKQQLEQSQRFDGPIVTEIVPATEFYAAEEYHQHYHEKNPVRYRFYRWNCGRDQRLTQLWGAAPAPAEAKRGGTVAQPTTQRRDSVSFTKPSETDLRQSLTPLQYQVIQQAGTEAPFHNAYWNNKEAGIYVDIVSGEPLFSSLDKYDSGTGWPSFTKPLEAKNIHTQGDRGLVWERTEVRSAHADSHLGHLFADGPPPTGLRYCMDSAALRFIPVEKLKAEGY